VPGWLDTLWQGAAPPHIETELVGRTAHAGRIATGGFPAALARPERRRTAWFGDYIAALATRDVPDIVDIRRPDLLASLLIQLAAGSGSLASMRPIAQALEVDAKTVRAYVRLLELLHLVVSVPAWARGYAGRAVRTPRLFVEDAGLMTYLLNADASRIAQDDALSGRAYESFVAMELARLLPHTEIAPRMHHWRGAHGEEVDIVLENREGKLVAIEIKAGATVSQSGLRGLKRFKALTKDRLMAGLVLCTTRQTIPLGRDMWAVPIEALWT
jgi:uncharacterized protein